MLVQVGVVCVACDRLHRNSLGSARFHLLRPVLLTGRLLDDELLVVKLHGRAL